MNPGRGDRFRRNPPQSNNWTDFIKRRVWFFFIFLNKKNLWSLLRELQLKQQGERSIWAHWNAAGRAQPGLTWCYISVSSILAPGYPWYQPALGSSLGALSLSSRMEQGQETLCGKGQQRDGSGTDGRSYQLEKKAKNSSGSCRAMCQTLLPSPGTAVPRLCSLWQGPRNPEPNPEPAQNFLENQKQALGKALGSGTAVGMA